MGHHMTKRSKRKKEKRKKRNVESGKQKTDNVSKRKHIT